MYKHDKPFITPKYPIEVPTNLYYSSPCVYKLNVGSMGKFYIGKCQSLPQSMAQIGVAIERAIRLRNNDATGWFYHLIAYIIKNRVMKAHVERLHEDCKEFTWELLKLEQSQLDKYKNDPNCLNNNFDVYIPKWISADQVDLFKKWKDETDKRNSSKNRTANPRKKHKGGQLAVRSNRRIPKGVRPKKDATKPIVKTRKKPK